eukprot:458298_1
MTKIHTKKDVYYGRISNLFTNRLITSVNITVSPCAFLGTMVSFCKFLYQLKFSHHNIIFNGFKEIVDDLMHIGTSKRINIWDDACKSLAAISISLELKALSVERQIGYPTTTTDHTVLRGIFEQITDTKVFGSMEIILNNIKNIYMHHVQQFQDSCWHEQQKYSNTYPLIQCYYILWYNLLNAAAPDEQQTSRTHILVKKIMQISPEKV